jgi:hypothetical protein
MIVLRAGDFVNDSQREYRSRLSQYETLKALKEKTHLRLGQGKLAVVALALVLLWMVAGRHRLSPMWLLVPAGLYAALAIAHELTLRARQRAETSAMFFRKGIARIEDRWIGTGQSDERFADPNHVYSADLDLFGRGSLFELLSTARLPMGEECLAFWLKNPAQPMEVLERQELVRELREKRELPLDIAVAGEELRARIIPESLVNWAERPTVLPRGTLRWLAVFLALAVAASAVYWFYGGAYWPLVALLLVNAAMLRWKRKAALEAVANLDTNAEGLLLFSRILRRIEREPFASARLRQLVADLNEGAAPASSALNNLARIVYWVDARASLLGGLAELPILYSIQVALAAEAWKRRWGSRLRLWASIAGEVEALLSLATYAYEHPNDPFPELIDSRERGAFFSGESLGHPLIPAAECVRNSVLLDVETRALLVSGSNMSGKSTLLRTVGINTVLAMAGAPVRATHLRLTPLAVGTRIRSGDSLQEGRSNFYTEILHIRRVFDLWAGGESRMHVLFLFDELLEGTNSHDRRIGAEGLMRGLLERGAIGMVTTHDLALTEIGASLGEQVRNVHFEDHVENGKMAFDYRLRDGVVTKSNAIALMRIVGLEV